MATELQEVFERIKEAQKKQKDIKSSYKEALEVMPQYKEVVEQLKTLKEKKKSLENQVKNDFNSEFAELDNLKLDMENDRQMMSDIALSTLMKGQTVELKDKYDNEYEPVFSVKFRKI